MRTLTKNNIAHYLNLKINQSNEPQHALEVRVATVTL